MIFFILVRSLALGNELDNFIDKALDLKNIKIVGTFSLSLLSI